MRFALTTCIDDDEKDNNISNKVNTKIDKAL